MTPPAVVFVGNARCFHTMDWFRSAQQVCAPHRVVFATDLIESEKHPRLINDQDEILPLFNIDRLLLREQSRRGNIWRNLLKFALLPLQALYLRRLFRRMPDAAYHAHTMYYMLLCQIAGVPFVGTPQGSEILVRPSSRVYRWFAIRALRAAEAVTVDSVAMADRIKALSGREAVVVQNGIDIAAMQRAAPAGGPRAGILSIRAITANYRIAALLAARARLSEPVPISFSYPFWDLAELPKMQTALRPGDRDLGRLPTRLDLYAEMRKALLVVSIPASDSSPRSVYEAIFAGAAVAVSANPYIDVLPRDMRERLVVVNLDEPEWLERALAEARRIVAAPYLPSDEALDRFDQRRSMQRVAESYYRGYTRAPAPAPAHAG